MRTLRSHDGAARTHLVWRLVSVIVVVFLIRLYYYNIGKLNLHLFNIVSKCNLMLFRCLVYYMASSVQATSFHAGERLRYVSIVRWQWTSLQDRVFWLHYSMFRLFLLFWSEHWIRLFPQHPFQLGIDIFNHLVLMMTVFVRSLDHDHLLHSLRFNFIDHFLFFRVNESPRILCYLSMLTYFAVRQLSLWYLKVVGIICELFLQLTVMVIFSYQLFNCVHTRVPTLFSLEGPYPIEHRS